MAKKAWKQAGQEAAKPQPTFNQIVRSAGYGDSFFDFLNRHHLKVADKKGAIICGHCIKIKLQGSKGNSFSQTITLPVDRDRVDVSVENFARYVTAAHAIIAQHNPSVRIKAERPQEESRPASPRALKA